MEGIGDIDVEGCSKVFFNDQAYRVWCLKFDLCRYISVNKSTCGQMGSHHGSMSDERG